MGGQGLFIQCIKKHPFRKRMASLSLEAMLVQNYAPPSYLLTGVRRRAKNARKSTQINASLTCKICETCKTCETCNNCKIIKIAFQTKKSEISHTLTP